MCRCKQMCPIVSFLNFDFVYYVCDVHLACESYFDIFSFLCTHTLSHTYYHIYSHILFRELDLSSNVFPEGRTRDTRFIAERFHSLTSLNLSECLLDDEGVDSLTNLWTLTSLTLSTNLIRRIGRVSRSRESLEVPKVKMCAEKEREAADMTEGEEVEAGQCSEEKGEKREVEGGKEEEREEGGGEEVRGRERRGEEGEEGEEGGESKLNERGDVITLIDHVWPHLVRLDISYNLFSSPPYLPNRPTPQHYSCDANPFLLHDPSCFPDIFELADSSSSSTPSLTSSTLLSPSFPPPSSPSSLPPPSPPSSPPTISSSPSNHSVDHSTPHPSLPHSLPSHDPLEIDRVGFINRSLRDYKASLQFPPSCDYPIPDLILMPGLFLGDWNCARNISCLRSLGVSHILCVAQFPHPYPSEFTYLSVPIRDADHEQIIDHFSSACNFIRDAMESQHGRILVHCRAGVSRSVSVVAAYIIWKFRLNWKSALDLVIHHRSCACPNDGFRRQLFQWEEMCESGTVSEKLTFRHLRRCKQ